MRDELRICGEWKIHLIIKINFESSKDSDEKQRMNSKIGNIEIMIGNNADKLVNEISLFTT